MDSSVGRRAPVDLCDEGVRVIGGLLGHVRIGRIQCDIGNHAEEAPAAPPRDDVATYGQFLYGHGPVQSDCQPLG